MKVKSVLPRTFTAMRKLWIPALLLATAFQFASAASYSAWSYYRTVTLTPDPAIKAETNYPLLVRLTSGDAVWANCNSNGYDVQFTASDGTTPLSFQRANWDYANGNAEFWVLLPAVNGSGTPTSFRMYWKNAGATDASNGNAVFATSNKYTAVWHMNAASGANETDATGNAVDQTAAVTGTPTNVTGPGGVASSIGKAISSGNYYTVTNSGTGTPLDFPPGGPYTLSCWINPTSTTQQTNGIMTKTYLNSSNAYNGTYGIMYRYGSNYLQTHEIYGSATVSTERVNVAEPSSGAWHHLVMVRNGTDATGAGGTTSTLAFYVDGVLQTATYSVFGTAPVFDNSVLFCIGKDGGTTAQGTHYFSGSIAEVAVQNAIRDSSWVALNYLTQGPTYGSYVALGVPVSAGQNPPTLATPTNNAQNLQTPVNFSWGSVSSATAYELQLSSTSSFGSTVYDNASLTATSATITGLAYSTSYYWRARAYASGWTGWSGTWSFATGIALPGSPTLTSPTNGATGQSTNLTLTWNTVSTATSYSVQVGTSSGFGSTVFQQSGLTSAGSSVSWTPAGGFAGATTYYWRANATNATGVSGWTTMWSFTTLMNAPAAPVLSSPTNGYLFTYHQTLSLTWGSASTASGYTLQVSTTSTFGTTVLAQTGTTTSIAFATGNVGQYYWRVNALNAGGVSSWSSVWTLIHSIDGVLPGSSNQASSTVSYRNGSLLYTLSARATVDITLFDVLGKEVYAMHARRSAGSYKLPLARSALAPGHYILRFKAGMLERTQQILIAK